MQPDHMQSHRQKIVKEIFDTEHTYISQLSTIVTVSQFIIVCHFNINIIVLFYPNVSCF